VQAGTYQGQVPAHEAGGGGARALLIPASGWVSGRSGKRGAVGRGAGLAWESSCGDGNRPGGQPPWRIARTTVHGPLVTLPHEDRLPLSGCSVRYIAATERLASSAAVYGISIGVSERRRRRVRRPLLLNDCHSEHRGERMDQVHTAHQGPRAVRTCSARQMFTGTISRAGARAATVRAVAFGALALGAAAIGALAIGRLVVGTLSLRRGHVHALVVDELHVGLLHVREIAADTRAPAGITAQITGRG
jgi:hypothetical protein